MSAAPLRRLTRFEYANAVRDVFGTDLGLEDLFPRDEVALGFDNQGGTLSLTDLHVDGYLHAANSIAEWLTSDPIRYEALGGCAETTAECARQLIGSIGRRLERQPVSDAELDGLMGLFGTDFSAEGFADGVSKVVTALLQNPRFLYRMERSAAETFASASTESSPTDGSPTPGLASPWVLASRLALLLWGSVPDETLLEAAAEGRLSSATDVEREARRLLADERAQRGVLHFYLQWLELTDLSEVEKDRQRFTIWNETLLRDLGRETERFIDGVLREDDARFETLLTAPYTFADAVLLDYYGLPIGDPDSTELQRVDFGSNVPRIGLLTQGAILAKQAKANQTDPIHRGKFIREHFFCQVPPPPPANLVVSPPPLGTQMTTRQRFEQHRTDPSCGGCHRVLDPVGFVFEHYDAMGRYRAAEDGVPIDATGYLYDTDVDGPLDGVPSLVAKLTESAQVRSCVVKQWFRYTFGRGESETDSCTLNKLERAFEESHGNLRELLVALTQVDAFLRPAPAPAAEEEEP